MDDNQKYLAFLEIKAKILESNGQKFEDLFVSIMNGRNLGFRAVKAQGQYGDKKNDGFIDSNGEYFQVYAPENFTKSINNAIEKLRVDSQGLLKHWNNIKKINYVINDKYQGLYPTGYLALKTLKEEIENLGVKNNIEINLIMSKDVENMFLQLPKEEIAKIISVAFINYSDYDINYNVINELITFISKIPSNKTNEKLNSPDFDKKISFNNISDRVKERMDSYYLATQEIDIFFENVGNYYSDTLKTRFNNAYIQAKELYITNSTEKNNDLIYFSILEKLQPDSASNAYITCLESMVAYYFESCDIYEEPLEEKI